MAAGNKTRVSDKDVRITVSAWARWRDTNGRLCMTMRSPPGHMVAIAKLLIEHGIESMSVVCTHGCFLHGNAIERLAAIPQIKEIVTT